MALALCNLFSVHVHFEIQNLRRTSLVFNFVLKNIQNLKHMKYYVFTMSITIIDQMGFVWTHRPSMFWHSNNITYHLYDTTKSIQSLRIQELVHFRWQRLIFTQVHEVAWVRIRDNQACNSAIIRKRRIEFHLCMWYSFYKRTYEAQVMPTQPIPLSSWKIALGFFKQK